MHYLLKLDTQKDNSKTVSKLYQCVVNSIVQIITELYSTEALAKRNPTINQKKLFSHIISIYI